MQLRGSVESRNISILRIASGPNIGPFVLLRPSLIVRVCRSVLRDAFWFEVLLLEMGKLVKIPG